MDLKEQADPQSDERTNNCLRKTNQGNPWTAVPLPLKRRQTRRRSESVKTVSALTGSVLGGYRTSRRTFKQV